MATNYLLVDDNGRTRPLPDIGAVSGGIATLLAACTSRVDERGRTVHNTHEVSLRTLERRIDSAVREAREELSGERADSGFDPGMGWFNPRDLTHKFRRILEERRKPRNAMRIFPVNTEVPPGALHYEQYRAYSSGEAVVYRGGSGADIGEVAIGQASTKANVVYLVSKATINWLESLRTNMAGLDVQARKMRAARLVIEELENRWAFEGSEAHDLYGLLNHPYVDSAISGVAYLDATNEEDIASDFAVWANYADNESGGAFGCDTLQIAPKLASYLRNRPFGDNADKSLMDWMLSANPHITRVELVRELNDAGGPGIHAMAFSRMGAGAGDTSMELVKPMFPTLLPPDRRALASEFFLVSAFGGLNQREVGDNLIVYVEGGL